LGAAEQFSNPEEGSLGMLTDLSKFYAGKRVVVTGHTGFKGSWLALWLAELGAEVFGFALEPPTNPSMFELCNLKDALQHQIGDIRNLAELKSCIADAQPDIVFHLAAQPLVRLSYAEPLETLSSNVMGTANVLEAIRGCSHACSVIVISSDKCYDNREWVWGYRENDPLGGKDPYSMSKGATELVVAAWRESYFNAASGIRLASARAGNVVGGGDWAADRIVPDCIRAFSSGQNVELRNPLATRPWQHVLEPLGGYLLLGSKLLAEQGGSYCSGWNFGPAPRDVRPVGDIVALMAEAWGNGASWSHSKGSHPKEAGQLALNCDKATAVLGWGPTWSLETVAQKTVSWFQTWQQQPEALKAVTLQQIAEFQNDASH
jgi:CDP-glucose 4,6-dehydratase